MEGVSIETTAGAATVTSGSNAAPGFPLLALSPRTAGCSFGSVLGLKRAWSNSKRGWRGGGHGVINITFQGRGSDAVPTQGPVVYAFEAPLRHLACIKRLQCIAIGWVTLGDATSGS